MSDQLKVERQLEIGISHLLRAGVLVSAALLAGGWLMDGMGRPGGAALMDAGIRVLISTPIVRVAATFVLFMRQRDALYATITALVLTFLAIGVFGGFHL